MIGIIKIYGWFFGWKRWLISGYFNFLLLLVLISESKVNKKGVLSKLVCFFIIKMFGVSLLFYVFKYSCNILV